MKYEFEIPFELGQRVFLMYGRIVRKGLIQEIKLRWSTKNKKPVISYAIGIISEKTTADLIETVFETRDDTRIFSTKTEAIFDWLETNKVNPRDTLQDFFKHAKEGKELTDEVPS